MAGTRRLLTSPVVSIRCSARRTAEHGSSLRAFRGEPTFLFAVARDVQRNTPTNTVTRVCVGFYSL